MEAQTIAPQGIRSRVRHELKCWPEFFAPTLRGIKRFELRRNDREAGFQVGDELFLKEWDIAMFNKVLSDCPKPPGAIFATQAAYTGREVLVRVDYIMPTGTIERLLEMNQNYPFPVNGFVIMSVSLI